MRLIIAAAAISCLAVWGIEKIIIARNAQEFQQQINQLADYLAGGKKKSQVQGSMVTIGTLDPIVRATAQGKLLPDNPKVLDLLAHIDHMFDLGDAFIINHDGAIVAYFNDSGNSGIGKNVSFRPYFRSAMAGTPNIYPALGTNTEERGIYVAAPIREVDAALSESTKEMTLSQKLASAPSIIGVVVAKIGFEEIDRILEQESDSFAVVSPEGVVFSSNVEKWRFRVLGSQHDVDQAKNDTRVNKAFEKNPPHRLEIHDQDFIEKDGHSLKMTSAPINWNDPQGAWRLLGFVDPERGFSFLSRVLVGANVFFIFMLGAFWWKAKQRARIKTEQVANLLNNSGQGFLSFDSNFIIDSECSRACKVMLDGSPAGKNAAKVFFPDDADKAKLFCMTISAVLDAPDPAIRESMLSLLPVEIQRGNILLKSEYKELPNGHLMVVLTDISEERRIANMLESERRHLELIVMAVTDSRNFFDIIDSFKDFISDALPRILNSTAAPQIIAKELYRHIHTFKGSFNQFGFQFTPNMLHEIESNLSKLQALGDKLSNENITNIFSTETLQSAFGEDLAIIDEALGKDFLDRGESIILSEEQARELENLANRLLSGEMIDTSVAEIRDWLKEIGSLRKVSLKDVLIGFDGLVKQASERLQKEVAPIEVKGGADIWIDPHVYRSFLHSLVHIFRNAVAHGLETPEARWEVDKDEVGNIVCSVAVEGNWIKLVIADDGAGINLEALRQRAVAAGIYSENEIMDIPESEIVKLIFMDNISTNQEVTELSGRGVGLAAVLNETRNLGGEVSVISTAGQGTEFIFTLPLKIESQVEMV